MPFHIDASDKPGVRDLRASVRPDHLAFLAENTSRLLAAGAKLDDDGNAFGSVYIVDVEDRAAAEAFIHSDPYSKAGVFGEIVVTRWRKAIFNFERVAPKT
jgi:uncharacterized protein YciI